MKKKLKFSSIILLTINAIIGTGIFLSPGSVTKTAGVYAPLIYFVAAILAIILAITFASAAKYVNKAGAAYAYSLTAFGNKVGFYVGITRFIAACIAWGVMATGVVKTVLSIYGGDSSSFKIITIGFFILMGILFIINLIGIRFYEFINNISTIGKLTALISAIVCGILIIIFTKQNHYYDILQLTKNDGSSLIPNMNVSLFVVATLAAFYAFTGFESVASASEDMEKPEKNLPKALPIGILIIACIYISIVYIAMMLDSSALVTTKEVVVLSAVFKSAIIKNIILYGSLISMLGINVAASFLTPRILEAIAKDGYAPKIFTKRTNKECPIYALLLTIALAIIIPISFKYSMTSIIILSSVSRFIQFLVVPIAVILFFFGKHKYSIITTAKKNVFTDIIIPILAFSFSCFLMIKFNWKAQFSVIDANGNSSLNIIAITAMLLGYILLPILLYFLRTKQNN